MLSAWHKVNYPDSNAMLSLQSFDELLLMKRGGRIIYFGPLGFQSADLVQYFEVSIFTTLTIYCSYLASSAYQSYHSPVC